MEGIQIIALSDYGKGFLTPTLIQAVIQEAQKRNIPVITDPKGQDFIKYAGTTLIKPNLSEAYAAANLSLSKPLEQVADSILEMTQAKLLMITRSDEGISLFEAGGKRHDFPVQAKKVIDVTGAGDTVLAMLTMALANGLSYEEACQLCNTAASLAIEQVGCARITLSDLAHHLLLKTQGQRGFLHEDLLEVVKKQSFNLLILPSIDQLSIPLFEGIKKMSGQSEVLLIYINDVNCSEIMLEMLASLKEVECILTHPEQMKLICQQAKPVQVCTYDEESQRIEIVDGWEETLKHVTFKRVYDRHPLRHN
jgi:D-beta-D-heptose 7-phosphate kinase/D-beta-D-heptose 1-phosphate adenosyltransferase